MSHLSRFELEAQQAGADISIALSNLHNGMCWQEAIESATPASFVRLDLPPITINDAQKIHDLVAGAEACLEQITAQVRTLLQQRDLVSVWNDTDAAFKPEFEATALQYHRLMRSLLSLKDEPFGWEHRLRWMVEAQR